MAVAQVAWVTPAGVQLGTLDPFELGFAKCTIEDLKGGDRVMNAQILTQILSGKLTGPVTDTVILNAGAALYVNGTAESIKVRRASCRAFGRTHAMCVRYSSPHILLGLTCRAAPRQAGCEMARKSIESGAPMATLKAWVDCCNEP